MKTNFKNLFALALSEGIEELQIQYSKVDRLSFQYFKGEIDSYKASTGAGLLVTGLYQGKICCYSTEKFDKEDFPSIVAALKEGATYKSEVSKVGLYEGAKRYRKKKLPASDLGLHEASEKIAIAKKLAEQALAYDPRIEETVQVIYGEAKREEVFENWKGLKLKETSSSCYYGIDVPAREGDVTKDAFNIEMGRRFDELKLDDLAVRTAKEVLAKFGATSIKSGNYPTVIKNDVFSSLIPYFVSAASAERLKRKTTFLLDKLGTKVASSKITISEKPLEPTLSYYYYDDEGYPAVTKDIVKRGVLNTYLYNRELAAEMGKETTGNGSIGVGKIGINFNNIFVKPGKKTFDEMISPIKKGVYITDIQGLGTGMNDTSGDFSCQAEGFLIEDGKLTKPLTLITLGGNLVDMLLNVKDLDNNLSKEGSDAYVPDVYVKKMAIGGI